MNTLRHSILLIMSLVCLQGMAQNKKIVFNQSQKEFLQEQARARVVKFQENCATIGHKSGTKSSKMLLIKQTMSLFVDDKRTIIVTHLNGKRDGAKLVSLYLNRLHLLGYKKVEITSSNFHISTEIRPSATMNDLHPGEDWYECICSVIQRFRGETWEYVYSDTVQRDFTVYLKRNMIVEGTEEHESWQVFIGDIEAQTISAGV